MNVLRLEETVLMNKVEFLEKSVFFLVTLETYWVMCYINYVFDYSEHYHLGRKFWIFQNK